MKNMLEILLFIKLCLSNGFKSGFERGGKNENWKKNAQMPSKNDFYLFTL